MKEQCRPPLTMLDGALCVKFRSPIIAESAFANVNGIAKNSRFQTIPPV